MYRALLGGVVALLLASAGFFFSALAGDGAARDDNATLAYGGLFLASLATTTGVYFGWRKDRREARKFKIEIELLESQRTDADDS